MKTAIDWLIEQTRSTEWHSLKRQDILEKAKEKEKQQIIDAYNDGGEKGFNKFGENAEDYYNETFGKL